MVKLNRKVLETYRVFEKGEGKFRVKHAVELVLYDGYARLEKREYYFDGVGFAVGKLKTFAVEDVNAILANAENIVREMLKHKR